jgi:hypothetical protein
LSFYQFNGLLAKIGKEYLQKSNFLFPVPRRQEKLNGHYYQLATAIPTGRSTI